ncbi:hypothetical protein B0T20DRAFT_153655 [Sordaria brevicollis]|uniref:Secreted protein n=1 Tax=Sordaria brevicollis TaxID=83679 RepID=A0AAE0UE55_SORBR|nr:hypothetical protein B0T20DRAFT_153655 [Sordaria brevicollis]
MLSLLFFFFSSPSRSATLVGLSTPPEATHPLRYLHNNVTLDILPTSIDTIGTVCIQVSSCYNTGWLACRDNRSARDLNNRGLESEGFLHNS